MFVLESYYVAVVFCVITMLCWGSWANTQKLAGKTWRFELFYWDYVIGVLLMSLLFAFTLGSMGEHGRGFIEDLRQADSASLASAFAGGVVFNAANILLVAAIAIAGMSVAFPVGIGLALVLGVILNYAAKPEGDPWMLFLGVALVTAAIVLNAMAYRRLPNHETGGGAKGLGLSVACGVLMSLFYYLVSRSIAKVAMPDGTLDDVSAATLAAGTLEAGKMTALTANAVFAAGIFVSNFVLNTIIMRKPFVGVPVSYAQYFSGAAQDHLWGIVGGCIWAVGMSLNIVAAGVAGPPVAYGLGQGATLVAAIWGVFIWREFRTARDGTNLLLALMFLSYIIGLMFVIIARLPPPESVVK
jgi:glucose uptake protein